MGMSAKEPAAVANGAKAAAVETKGATTVTRDATGDPPPAKKARVEDKGESQESPGLVDVDDNDWHTPPAPPEEVPKDFGAMTKHDLVEECRARGLKGSGTKAQVLSRLKEAQHSHSVEKSKEAKQEAKSKSGQVKRQGAEEKDKHAAKKAPELTAVGVAFAKLEKEIEAASDLSKSQLADECHARGLDREGTLMQLIYRLVEAKPSRRTDDSVAERARMFVQNRSAKFTNRMNQLLVLQKKEAGETLADDE